MQREVNQNRRDEMRATNLSTIRNQSLQRFATPRNEVQPRPFGPPAPWEIQGPKTPLIGQPGGLEYATFLDRRSGATTPSPALEADVARQQAEFREFGVPVTSLSDQWRTKNLAARSGIEMTPEEKIRLAQTDPDVARGLILEGNVGPATDIGSQQHGPEGAPLPGVVGKVPGFRTLPEAAATLGTAGIGLGPGSLLQRTLRGGGTIIGGSGLATAAEPVSEATGIPEPITELGLGLAGGFAGYGAGGKIGRALMPTAAERAAARAAVGTTDKTILNKELARLRLLRADARQEGAPWMLDEIESRIRQVEIAMTPTINEQAVTKGAQAAQAINKDERGAIALGPEEGSPAATLKQKFTDYLSGVKSRRPDLLAGRKAVQKERLSNFRRLREENMARGDDYDTAVAKAKAALKGPQVPEGLETLPEIEITPQEGAWLTERRMAMPDYQQIQFQEALARIGRADPAHPVRPFEWALIKSVWGEEMADALKASRQLAIEEADRTALAGLDPTAPVPANLERGSEMVGVPDSTEFRPVPVNKPPSREKAESGLLEKARKSAEKKAKEADRLKERQRKAMAKEWERARKAAEKEYEKGRKAATKGAPKTKHLAGRIIEGATRVPVTVMTSLDQSIHLAQLWKATPRNPGAAFDAWRTDLKIWQDPEYAEKKMAEMLADDTPIYIKGEDGRIYSTTWGDVADKNSLYLDENNPTEDFYLSTIPERFPDVGQTIGGRRISTAFIGGGFKRSRLGFTMAGNVMRHKAGLKLTQKMMKHNGGFVTPTDLKQMREFILPLTGRGSTEFLGPWVGNTLRHLGFAPGFRFSGPQTAMRLASPNPVIRQAAAENLASWFTANMAILGAAYFAGQKVNIDPLHPDFGTFRIGDTSYSLWGSDVILARTIARSIMGSGHSRDVVLPDGTVQKIEWDTSWKEQWLNYLRSGANPVVGDIINLSEGENIVGEKVNLNTKEGITNFVESHAPLHAQNISDIWNNEDTLQAILSIPFITEGLRSSTYPQTKDKTVSAIPKYEGVTLEQQRDLGAFRQEVEDVYREVHGLEPDSTMTKRQVADSVAQDWPDPEIAAFGQAYYADELPLNYERIGYIMENQDDLETLTLRRSIPVSVAERILSPENLERYNSIDIRISYEE